MTDKKQGYYFGGIEKCVDDKSNCDKSLKKYDFGGIEEYNLQEIEKEILNDSIYLDVFAGSDERFKTDITPVSDGLKSILNLNAYKFSYKTEDFPENNFDSSEQIGIIAQDVEKVFPQVVKTDDNGYRYVNYAMLTPGLIEAVKDLNSIVEQQGEQIKKLQEQLKK